AGDRIRDARSGGDQRHADLGRRARIAIRGMHGALLVAHENVLDLVLLEELVVDVEDRAARIAEDVLDALFLEAADDDFGTRELHGNPLLRDEGTVRRTLNRLASALRASAPI